MGDWYGGNCLGGFGDNCKGVRKAVGWEEDCEGALENCGCDKVRGKLWGIIRRTVRGAWRQL